MKLNETCTACGLCVRKEHKTSEPGKTGQYADPCLGVLPGVKYACCGHGNHGYIFFENGITIRFDGLTIVERTLFSRFHAFNEETTKKKDI